jgi:hypothetical protein
MKRVTILLSLVVFLTVSCEKKEHIDNCIGDIDLKIGETTEIKSGEIACNAQYELSLRVESVDDGRCPEGVMCFWEGEASVQLHLNTKKGEYNFILKKRGLGGSSCEGVVIEGFRYYLIDVLPYPTEREDSPIKIVKILITQEVKDCDQDVIISADEYENAPNDLYDPINDKYNIIDMEIVGNCLKIKFWASGCDGNTWVVKLIDLGLIAESIPCQRTLRVSLDNKEACRAVIEKEISFNIEALQIQGDNRVQLNVSGKSILYEY